MKTDKPYRRSRLAIFAVLFVVLGASAYGTYVQYDRINTSNDVATVATAVEETTSTVASTTAVLSATDSKGLEVTSATKQTDGTYLVVVENSTSAALDFSPGLQLFAVATDGSEIAISRLGVNQPLNGGPIDSLKFIKGNIEFATSKQISQLRLYSTPEKLSYKEFSLN